MPSPLIFFLHIFLPMNSKVFISHSLRNSLDPLISSLFVTRRFWVTRRLINIWKN